MLIVEKCLHPIHCDILKHVRTQALPGLLHPQTTGFVSSELVWKPASKVVKHDMVGGSVCSVVIRVE